MLDVPCAKATILNGLPRWTNGKATNAVAGTVESSGSTDVYSILYVEIPPRRSRRSGSTGWSLRRSPVLELEIIGCCIESQKAYQSLLGPRGLFDSRILDRSFRNRIERQLPERLGSSRLALFCKQRL